MSNRARCPLREMAPCLTQPLLVLLLFVALMPPPPLQADQGNEAFALHPTAGADLRSRLREYRQQEATAKEQQAKLLLAAEANRTPNQEQYDIHHYDLDLTLEPDSHSLTGTVAITAEVTGAVITNLELHLANNLTVSAATAGGGSTTWAHADGIVTVELDRTYSTGETVVVSVTYAGNPANGDHFGWSSYADEHMIWTLSEPFGARSWWPCKDLTSDKADSLDIRVTLPDQLIVASNGLLVSDVDNGSTRSFHWRTGYPIATYLVSLSAYPYLTYSDWYDPLIGGNPMEVQFFVFPDRYEYLQANYALTVPMITAFAEAFGEYPFVNEKYGHAEFWGAGAGMEHQTITSLGTWTEELISHELAHHWWGNMITCHDFGHIWLNEGFATWSEAYWQGVSAGPVAYQAYMNASVYFGGGTVFVENPLNDYIFDVDLSYNKGSWVVHMLRGVLGDPDFFAGLALYRSTYKYGTATTEQLHDAMESVSGKDLDVFFDQWIYNDFFPTYRYYWCDLGGVLDLTIQQRQTSGLFTMPITVRVTTSTGTTDIIVQNSLITETYQLAATDSVENVELDPDRWILRMIETSVDQPSFAEGILLVNGLDWHQPGCDIFACYEDSIFWGDNGITFWDTFNEPAEGYPANLPSPLGHGSVPGNILGRYSTVIWIGNDHDGDLPRWQETPIQSYLDAGGNVLLITRLSRRFFDWDLRTHLGVTWSTDGSGILGNCLAVFPGLVDIPFTGTLFFNDVYLTSVASHSTLLFRVTSGFGGPRGSGVYAAPPDGGTHRDTGGKFVHIAGQPYYMDHDALRTNLEFILETLLDEPYDPRVAVPEAIAVPLARLLPNYPNPFNPATTIPFTLPRAGQLELAVYDAAGRLVRTVLTDSRPAGTSSATWDGTDEHGRSVASGTYFARLRFENESLVQPLVLVR